jgi:hypothetical protein
MSSCTQEEKNAVPEIIIQKEFFDLNISSDFEIPQRFTEEFGQKLFPSNATLHLSAYVKPDGTTYTRPPIIDGDSIKLLFYSKNDGQLLGKIESKLGSLEYNIFKDDFQLPNESILFQDVKIDVFVDTTLMKTVNITTINYPKFVIENTISHDKIYRDYQENEANFDNLYVRKLMFVQGAVKRINNVKGKYIVYLKDTYSNFSLEDEESNFSLVSFGYELKKGITPTNLRTGDSVVIMGKCSRPNSRSDFSLDDIIFEHCELVQ